MEIFDVKLEIVRV